MGEPQGSAFDAEHQPRRSKKLSRRVRKWFTWRIVGITAWLFPYLYLSYCWFVWRTSRVEDRLTDPMRRALGRHDRVVGLLWHQEVFTVAYGYSHMRPHTIASTSNFGRIITRMLERCGFTVFRGGSSRARIRRRQVSADMIEHMLGQPQVLYGITVDGSHGPPFVMKRGGVSIAQACKAPIFVTRTWYSRYLQLDTWDRTAIPLPFGRIGIYAVGPFWVGPDEDRDELRDALAHMQAELLDLTSMAYRLVERKPYGYTPEGYPEDWSPRWQPGVVGLKRTRWDLEPDCPPPWANRRPHAVSPHTA